MLANTKRIDAVIAALEKVQEHVIQLGDDEDIECANYNRWIAMLDGVVDGNWKGMMLSEDVVPAQEMAMHLAAAIAFLEKIKDT